MILYVFKTELHNTNIKISDKNYMMIPLRLWIFQKFKTLEVPLKLHNDIFNIKFQLKIAQYPSNRLAKQQEERVQASFLFHLPTAKVPPRRIVIKLSLY
jgi:hypothetical protein